MGFLICYPAIKVWRTTSFQGQATVYRLFIKYSVTENFVFIQPHSKS